MRLVHPDHPDHVVWLGYCLNVHPGDTLEAILEGLRDLTVPLRERLAPHAPFGVGLYLPGAVAHRVDRDAEAMGALRSCLEENELVPFTANAFPLGGFHRPGLKEGVYSPAWDTDARRDYTLEVARALHALCPSGPGTPRRLSLSTHPGGFGSWVDGPATLHAYSQGFAEAVASIHELCTSAGRALSLGLEAEPRASAGTLLELAEFLVVARTRAARLLREHGLATADEAEWLVSRLLGTCLDTCHAAVEFEEGATAWSHANLGAPCSKIQLSSALALPQPGRSRAGREALLALDEPVYLHQTTGRLPDGTLLRSTDLQELRPEAEDAERWLECEEWRCHFHVPVDLEAVGGLGTTRAAMDATLDAALAEPDRWGDRELHLELETYTWSVLPDGVRGAGALVDGIEREYRHALERLALRGWRPAAPTAVSP